MVDIFSEIEEDLRRDRMTQVWSRWGGWILAGVIGLVLVVAAVVGWREWQGRQNRANAFAFSQAVQTAQAGDTEKALAELDALRAKGGGYGVLARLRAASLLSGKGDVDAAVRVYDEVAADGGVEAVYRDLATVRSVLLQLDKGDPKALIARLEPLTRDTSPWHPSAIELTALLQQRAGDTEKARSLFKQLADDPATPPAMRQRATEMLSVLGSSAG